MLRPGKFLENVVASGKEKRAPNITIDTNISTVHGLEFDEIEACIESLALSSDVSHQVRELASRFCEEALGTQDRVRLGEIIESLRQVSEKVYEDLAKPLFITFLRKHRRG